jgi:ABC-type amino acid transport substrate-binding protein
MRMTRHTGALVAAFFGVLALLGAGCRTRPCPVAPILRVGITASRPPICYRMNKQPAGLEVDFARDLADALGRRLHLVTMEYERLLPAVQERKIDIAMAGLAATESRRLNVAFANPYLRNGQMAAMRSGDLGYNTDLRTSLMLMRSVGVEKGSTAEAYVRGRMVRSKVTTYRDLRQAVPALLARDIDLIIADLPVLIQLSADSELSGMKAVMPLLTDETLAWAVNKEDGELLAQINQVLETWRRDGTLAARIAKWMPYHEKYDLAIR